MIKQKKKDTVLNILVIEDEPALREAITIKLTAEGFRCQAAETAEDGLKILKKGKPDLVWLDLLMPGMGGFAFLEKIRKHPKWRDLPVLIVSVSASPEKIRLAFGLNIVDYLVKSQFRLDDIAKRIRNYIKK